MKQLDVNLMHPVDQINVIIGRIYRSGMTTTSGGNISIKDENGDIWITLFDRKRHCLHQK